MQVSTMHARVRSASLPGYRTDHTITAVWRDEPLKQDKGERLGSCNRTACQGPGAFWYNRTMRAWYCTSCANMINHTPLPDGEYLCILNEEARMEYYDNFGEKE